MLKYVSTRGRAKPLGFKETVLAGLAEDGGLYVPGGYPRFTSDELNKMRNSYVWGYKDIAFAVLSKLAPDIPARDLKLLIQKTYTGKVFGTTDITPLRWLESGLALLQLSNGPTLAFKDVALQLLGNLMEYVLEESRGELNILGATSGDTGSAAEYAVRGKEGIRIFMLSPHGRMSEFQANQMYTLQEENVFNLAVNGTFDECQAVVKEVFGDVGFKQRYSLGAVNSINWARIAAQVVYYFYACSRSTNRPGDEIIVVVPSGNFGNAFAAHVAREMGAPIRTIVVATNENDVLHEFFRTGSYRVRASQDVFKSTSPSMDIASASNIERLWFDALERDSAQVRELCDDVKQKGGFDGHFITGRFGYKWASGKTSFINVRMTIREVYDEYGVIIDPHTAVAVNIAEHYMGQGVPVIVAETAQPAKFEDEIKEAIGIKPPVPPGYKNLGDLPHRVTRIDPDPQIVKDFIAAHVPR